MHHPSATQGYQPINCVSDINYVTEHKTGEYERFEMNEEDGTRKKKRDLTEIDKNDISNYPSNRTFYLNCTDSDVICSKITCKSGPYRDMQDATNIILRMIFNSTAISG